MKVLLLVVMKMLLKNNWVNDEIIMRKLFFHRRK